ncbi:hypothetical protein RUM43_000881 [Polyplax serrata]|uniref:Uncharacterized protein n=1 Tax=Polyplax serrata TaxID=468196 RepID=A0AAN8SEI3_POLSC
MEFIPLDNSKKGKNKKVSKKNVTGKGKLEKKIGSKVKNYYREKILQKHKQKGLAKKLRNTAIQNEDDSDDDVAQTTVKDEEESYGENAEDIHEENEDSKEEEEEDSDDAEDKKEQAIREKWKKMDEKKKNRLFVKMKKKIVNESQVKELHPDIKQVIFPRKKNSKWCWAVFVSEERAHEAFLKLAKNKSVFVSKPNDRSQVEVKREKKMQTVKRKQQAKKKLLDLWT